jgi:hypothetical protein
VTASDPDALLPILFQAALGLGALLFGVFGFLYSMHGALKAQFQADLPRIVPEWRKLGQVTAWLIVASTLIAGVAVSRLSAGG